MLVVEAPNMFGLSDAHHRYQNSQSLRIGRSNIMKNIHFVVENPQ